MSALTKRSLLLVVLAGAVGALTGGLLGNLGLPWWIWLPLCVAEGWVLGKAWPQPRCRSCRAGIHRHLRTAECRDDCYCTEPETQS